MEKNSKYDKVETRYKMIVERSTDVIYITDSGGHFTYLNPVAERVTGYSNKELLGKHFTKLIVPEYRKNAARYYQDQLDSGTDTTYYEFPIQTKSGELRWISQNVQLMNIDGSVEFSALATDITDRRNYEEKILLQKEKYENIITNMNLGLLEVDLNERIQYANPGFTLISGYSKEELLGKKATDFLVSESQISAMRERQKAREKGVSDSYELQAKNKQGEIRWWMISGAPNYDEHGTLKGTIGIHLDITDKKKLEEALKLEKEKAEASSKAKAAFLANMSHEIRTPLNGIIGMIRQLSYEPLQEKQGKYVKDAAVASQHLLSVLNNVLDISKIEAGELSLEHHHFNLRDTIREVKMIMAGKAREKRLFFGLDLREIKNKIYIGDSARIRQVLLNLVGNAIKFTMNGAVFVECKVKAEMQNRHVISIVVEDTGIGMDEAYQSRLFRQFSQEDSSTSRRFGGTGLGMAITREIIQLMEGSISVKSKKNEGTRIELSFELPVGETEKVDKSENSGSLTSICDAKVLLVEDNPFNRIVACNALERFKCEVTEAENGSEAIAILKEKKFDVILMDLQMPLMDGFETTKAIRTELHLKTPIIALTANAFKSELQQCIEIGMNDYITKPFEEDKLLATISRNLNLQFDPPVRKEEADVEESTTLYDLGKLKSQAISTPEQVKKMISIFNEQIISSIHQLTEALESENMEAIYKIIHRIKPSVLMMGIEVLREDLTFIDSAARNQNGPQEIKKRIPGILSILEKAVTQLRQELNDKG